MIVYILHGKLPKKNVFYRQLNEELFSWASHVSVNRSYPQDHETLWPNITSQRVRAL